MKEKHPLEYLMAPVRAMENAYSRLDDNEILLTNFPTTQTINEEWIMDLVNKHAPYALVQKITLNPCYNGGNRVSSAVISFETTDPVLKMKRALRKHWIDNKVLKVKIKNDRFVEDHNQRTIVVSGFPNHVKDQEIAEHFS